MTEAVAASERPCQRDVSKSSTCTPNQSAVKIGVMVNVATNPTKTIMLARM